jgi:hypothetical protein
VVFRNETRRVKVLNREHCIHVSTVPQQNMNRIYKPS